LRTISRRLVEGEFRQSIGGTAGPGSPSHVSDVSFQNAIGSNFQFIPYRSAGLSTQDLVAGQIDMDTAATSGGYVKNGLIKAYAITGKIRSSALPPLPGSISRYQM
jgi:tripartite-type tricarboxylate transporter receptor subunit TctC